MVFLTRSPIRGYSIYIFQGVNKTNMLLRKIAEWSNKTCFYIGIRQVGKTVNTIDLMKKYMNCSKRSKIKRGMSVKSHSGGIKGFNKKVDSLRSGNRLF